MLNNLSELEINNFLNLNHLNNNLIIESDIEELKDILNTIAKSDATFILINPSGRNFDIIIKNKIAKSINSQELLKILESNLK